MYDITDTDMYRFLKSERKTLALVSLAYLLMTLVMFWPVTLGFGSTVVHSGDAYQSMWNLWWSGYSTFTLHTNLYFTSLLYHPIGANLVVQDLMPLAGIIGAPLQLLGLAAEYNTIFVLGFVLTGLFTYALAYYLARDRRAAFIAGAIFAFAPVHIAHAYAHLNWTSLEFIPLFILFFLMFFNERKQVYVFGAAVSFVLLTFAGDLLQAVMTSVFIALFLAYMLVFDRKRVLDRRFLIGLCEIVAIFAIIGSPFLIQIVSSVMNSGIVGESLGVSTISQNMQFSDDLAAFFLPSSFNAVFNGVAAGYYQIYKADINEKVSYIGYSVLFLSALAVLNEYRNRRFPMVFLWLFVIIVFAWLALGPYVSLGGSSTGLPGIYLLYANIPLFNLLREPGRFDVIAELGFAMLAAFGFVYLSEAAAKRYPAGRAKTWLFALFLAFILIEYNGMPSNALAQQWYMNVSIPKVFYSIGNSTQNYTVMLLPDTPNQTLPAFYLGESMYYQTAFKKPMIGGYTSRENSTQYLSTYIIPLSIEGGNLEMGNGFSYASPINENYTRLTLLLMQEDNVQYVGVIKQAYNQSSYSELHHYLYSVFGAPVYDGKAVVLFDAGGAILKNSGYTVAYTAGEWIPGQSLCSYLARCNQTIADMWFGGNATGVEIYSPAGASVTLGFDAFSPVGSELYLYANGKLVKGINLTAAPGSYSAAVTLHGGFNQVVFYARNTTQSAYQYMDYGVENITFS